MSYGATCYGENVCECLLPAYFTSKTPDVAIDERGLVRNVHLFVCVHNAVKYYIVY